MSSPEGRREAEDEEEMERSHRGLGRWQLRPGVQNEELISEGTYPSVPRAEMQASYGLELKLTELLHSLPGLSWKADRELANERPAHNRWLGRGWAPRSIRAPT